MKITDLSAAIIQDSRGQPTIEVNLSFNNLKVRAGAPSGKSRGKLEAVFLSAQEALLMIEKLKPHLLQREFKDLKDFEENLLKISTPKGEERFGNNVFLVLEIAFLKLLAKENDIPLYQLISQISRTEKPTFPLFFVNLINGGLHAKKEDLPLAFQEYLIIPQERSPKSALRTVFNFIEVLKGAVLDQQGRLIEGDEGGFVISGDEPEIGLSVLKEALRVFQAREKSEIRFGLDAAASGLFEEGVYRWRNEQWTNKELGKKYEELSARYNLFSIEDPFDEEGWEDWQKLTKEIGRKTLIVGDDLTVTNSQRMEKAKGKEAISALIIKPNQIGSVAKTIEAIQLAKKFGWKIIVSHRSGETDDDFIADLAYGVAADGLKAGSPLQSERLVKYERLIDIEKNLQKI